MCIWNRICCYPIKFDTVPSCPSLPTMKWRTYTQQLQNQSRNIHHTFFADCRQLLVMSLQGTISILLVQHWHSCILWRRCMQLVLHHTSEYTQSRGQEKNINKKSQNICGHAQVTVLCKTCTRNEQGQFSLEFTTLLCPGFFICFLQLAEGLTNWSVKHITQVRISRPLPPSVDWMHAPVCVMLTTWGNVQKRLHSINKSPPPQIKTAVFSKSFLKSCQSCLMCQYPKMPYTLSSGLKDLYRDLDHCAENCGTESILLVNLQATSDLSIIKLLFMQQIFEK